MFPAPATVLAYLNSLRIIALVLFSLIIAPLAFLASQSYADAYVSTSHFSRIIRIIERS